MPCRARSLRCRAWRVTSPAAGVTAFLGTTWTDSGKRIDAALRAIAAAMSQPAPGAQLLGAHLEGPYLNAERCGAQHSDYIRLARAEEALPWLDLGVIRLLALAPEFARNQWLIGEAVNRGVTVSAAHSNASYKQMKNAVAAGLRQATHIFNAMSPLHHREPGAVGAALSLDAISCELICDLVHVHPAAIRVLHRCKGVEKLILITDSVAIAGLPDGVYRHGHHDVEKKAGVIRIAADGTLAGSALTMNAALKNLMDVLDEPLEALWPTASLNPARAIGVDDRKGSIAPGKDADLALIDDCLNVQATIVAGNLVYRADE